MRVSIVIGLLLCVVVALVVAPVAAQTDDHTVRVKVFVNPTAYYPGIEKVITDYLARAESYGINHPAIHYQVVGIEQCNFSPLPVYSEWDRTMYVPKSGSATSSNTNICIPASRLKKSGLEFQHELYHTLGLDDTKFADETTHPWGSGPALHSVIGTTQWEILNIMRACNVDLNFMNAVVLQNIARLHQGLPVIYGKSYWNQPGGVTVTVVNVPGDTYSVQTLGDGVWYGVYRKDTILQGQVPVNGVLTLQIPQTNVRSGFAITGTSHVYVILPVTFEAVYSMTGKHTDAVTLDANTEQGWNGGNYKFTGVPSGVLMPLGFVPPDVMHSRY